MRLDPVASPGRRQEGPSPGSDAPRPRGVAWEATGEGQARGGKREPAPSLDPEHLAGAEALPAAAAPHGDPGRAVDLPAAVATHDRRVLVDPQDDRATWRLERDQGRQRLGPRVVVRHDRHPRREPEAAPPPEWERHESDPEVEGETGECHRAG